MISPVVCSNSDDYSALVILASGKVVAGQTPLYEIKGGRSVLHREAWHGETVSISALAKGVYVVKAGEHTAKFKK